MAEQAEGDLDAELHNLRFDLEEQDEKQEMNVPGGVLPRRGGPTGRTMAPGSKNVVCIHYLVGMCALDKDCPYLHQYDLDRVPICPFGSKCVRDDDCPFKHVMEEDKVECVFYRQGFCMYGPFCRYRHVHRAPEECPEEADFNIHQRDTEDGFADHHGHSSHHHLMGGSRRSSRGSQGGPPSSRGGGREGMMMVMGGGGGQQQQQRGGDDDNRRPGGALEKNENYKTTLCNHWLSNKGLCPFGEDCVFAHGEAELRKHPLAIAREQQQAQRGGRFHPGAAGGANVGLGMGSAGGGPPGPPIPAPHEVRFAELGIPWQENWRVRFFVIKSLNYKNLAQSVRRGVWRTHRNNERTLNEAFQTCDKVVLFFSVNESGHWQGSAVMTSPIRPQSQIPPMMHSMQHHQDGWTAEFSLDWLRLVSLPFPHTRPLRNPLNDNLPISRSRDCQELTPEIGRQLLYLIYASPEVSLSLTGDGPMGYGGPMMSGGAHGGPGMSSMLSNQSQGGGMDNHLMDAIYLPEHQQQHNGGGGAAGLHQLPSSSASAGEGRGDFPIFPGPGFIFPVTQENIEECLGRGLLGLPTGSALENVVKDIVAPGSTLFLANASNRTVLGVFEAASPMTYNLEPNAWAISGFNPGAGGVSPYPLQVRIRCILEAPPVSETDPDVRSILGPYAGAGEVPGRAGPISDDQAQRLANLMASRAGVSMAGGLGSSLLRQQQQQGGQQGGQQQQQGGSSSSRGKNSHGSSNSMLPPSPIMPPSRDPTQQRQPPSSGYAVRSPSMGPSSSISLSTQHQQQHHHQNQQQTQHHPPPPPSLHHGPSSGSSSSHSNSNNNNNNMMLPPSHHHHHSPTYHLSKYHKASLGASGGSTTSSTATSSSSHGSPLIDHSGPSSLSPTVLGLSPSTGSLNMRSSSSAGHQGGPGMMLPPPFVAAPPGVPLPASWRPL